MTTISPEVITLIKENINSQNQLKKIVKSDLFRNYSFRELLNAYAVGKVDSSYHNTILDRRGLHGDDFYNNRTERGEDKSSQAAKPWKSMKERLNVNNVKFEFDKCNDSYKRASMLEVKAYSFGFYDAQQSLLFVAYVNVDEGIVYLNDIIRREHKIICSKIQESEKSSKRLSRDSIVITGVGNSTNLI